MQRMLKLEVNIVLAFCTLKSTKQWLINNESVNDRWKVWGYNWDRCCHDMCLAVS